MKPRTRLIAIGAILTAILGGLASSAANGSHYEGQPAPTWMHT